MNNDPTVKGSELIAKKHGLQSSRQELRAKHHALLAAKFRVQAKHDELLILNEELLSAKAILLDKINL